MRRITEDRFQEIVLSRLAQRGVQRRWDDLGTLVRIGELYVMRTQVADAVEDIAARLQACSEEG